MKIAIFHNFLDNIGGAEKLVLTLARELKADVYATNIDKKMIRKMGFETDNIFSIGTVPVNAPQRQQVTAWRFRMLNLGSKYDHYIIAGDWAFTAAFNHTPNMWYIHSPARELWDLYEFTRQNGVPWYARWFFDLWVYYNRYLSKQAVSHVNIFACNSLTTKKRIQKYLQVSATVIHPPVDAKKITYKKNGKYWLSVNRLVSHKRIEIQLEAFANMPDKKLIMVGSYEQSQHFLKYQKRIQSIMPNNVELRSWVTEKELRQLYATCRGFITTSMEEDFGMTAIEAMAAGKPVIAPNEGGYRESVIDGETGILINCITSKNLVSAIKRIDKNPEKYRTACERRAQDFDVKKFTQSVKSKLQA